MDEEGSKTDELISSNNESEDRIDEGDDELHILKAEDELAEELVVIPNEEYENKSCATDVEGKESSRPTTSSGRRASRLIGDEFPSAERSRHDSGHDSVVGDRDNEEILMPAIDDNFNDYEGRSAAVGGDDRMVDSRDSNEDRDVDRRNYDEDDDANDDGGRDDDDDDYYNDENSLDRNEGQVNAEGGSQVNGARLYRNKLNTPIYSVGNTELTYAKAKLFGLLDENGQLRLDRPGENSATKVISKQRVADLSMPRPLANAEDIEDEEAKELKFKPGRSKEAEAAMRNPRCGYDFVDRLKDRGDFLENAFNGGKKGNKAKQTEMEVAKQDYEARLDKLHCPKCKMPQSFDEFWEKRRVCARCKERFTKLNVTSGASLEKRNREAEERRRAKLAAVEAEMYGPLQQKFVARKPPSGAFRDLSPRDRPMAANPRTMSAAGAKSSSAKEEQKGKDRKSTSTAKETSEADLARALASVQVAAPKPPSHRPDKGSITGGDAKATALRQMEASQLQNNRMLTETLIEAQKHLAPGTGKPPTGRSMKPVDETAAKFQKLVS